MASDPPKVLISYSHDSPEHEQRVLELVNRLRKNGVEAWIDRYRPDPDEGWISWMRDHIERADRVLLVFTETYARRFLGKEVPSKGLGVTFEGVIISQALYETGIHNAKFRPVVFREEDEGFIPLELRRVNRYRVGTEENYQKLLRWLHRELEVEIPPIGPKPEFSLLLGQLHEVPDLPRRYSPRQVDLAVLRQKLLAGAESVAITGMGGIGKTVLALALAHDPEVCQAFPDGLYWLTVGQKPARSEKTKVLLDLQAELLNQLTGYKPTLSTAKQGKGALRQALAGRRVLVILDDVWELNQLQALEVTTSPASLLVTTRKQEVLASLDAQEHPLKVLARPQSLQLLAEWAAKREADKLPPEAAEVAQECGDLPLALAMIGAMVRMDPRPTAWWDALARLRRADLAAIKVEIADYSYPDLLRAIEVSVDGLESADRERYLDLAVFREGQSVPESALSVLWKLDAIDTRGCMARLATSSLASWTMGESGLLLHDLLRDFVYKRREKDLGGLHLRLVEAWDGLPKLPDLYAWRWVAYHVVKAGRKDDLRRLLLDFDWLQAKLAATDLNALITDYDYLREDKDLQLVQSAIRLSAHVLAQDNSQLAGQLTGRLLGSSKAAIAFLLDQAAEKASLPRLRPIHTNLTPPGGPLIRTLQGHSESVYGVAITPDGRYAVSASGDKTLRVWDLESGQTLRTFEGHTDRVNAVAVTSGGCLAVSASNDETLRVWDLESGKSLRTLENRSIDIAVDIANFKTLAALAKQTTLGKQSQPTEKVSPPRLEPIHANLPALPRRTASMSAVAITPDGRRAVSASGDATLRIWDLESGQRISTLKGHTDSVSAVAVTPDGRRALSASGKEMPWLSSYPDTTPRIWDLETGNSLRTLQGHTNYVRAVVITPDGRRAVSASGDMTLRVWDLESGHSLWTLQGQNAEVGAVAIALDGRRAVSASFDNTLRIWDLESGHSLRTLQGHNAGVDAVAITPDGHRAVSASFDNTLRVWDLGTGHSLRTLQGHNAGVDAVAITPDGYRAISASFDNTLRVWDLESGHSLWTLQGHTNCIRAVVVTPDSRQAISVSDDETLRVWDLRTGQSPRKLKGHTADINAMAITPDGRRAVTASDDKTLRVWHLESGKELTVFTGESPMGRCAIAPDGQTIIAGDSLGQMHFLRLVEADKTKPAIGDTRIQLLHRKEQVR
jgi:WD40 repeat protein